MSIDEIMNAIAAFRETNRVGALTDDNDIRDMLSKRRSDIAARILDAAKDDLSVLTIILAEVTAK